MEVKRVYSASPNEVNGHLTVRVLKKRNTLFFNAKNTDEKFKMHSSKCKMKVPVCKLLIHQSSEFSALCISILTSLAP